MEKNNYRELHRIAKDVVNKRTKVEEEKDRRLQNEKQLSLQNCEDFVDKHKRMRVKLPSGRYRDLRHDFAYADDILSAFEKGGYDAKARMDKLIYNITFPVWRQVVFFTDIDVRDILMRIRNNKAGEITRGFVYILNELMQLGFKEHGFSRLLNVNRGEAAKYGSSLKKVTNVDGYRRVEVVSWHDIIAYDVTCTDEDHIRKVQRINLTFKEAQDYFENHDDEVKHLVAKEINFAKQCDRDHISFDEFWDYHYIDNKYQWGKVLYINNEYYADLYGTHKDIYNQFQLDDKPQRVEIERTTSGYTTGIFNKKEDRDPFVVTHFINPIPNICNIGLGIPLLVKALQVDMDEKSHLKRKGDFSAYKSIWLYENEGGGDISRTLESKLREGLESDALLTFEKGESLQRVPIGAPLQSFYNDYNFLEQLAMKIVGVNQLTAQEEKASKSATQSANEASREQTSFNFFIEEQELAIKKLLSLYAKSLILSLKSNTLHTIITSPKRIEEIRKYLFLQYFSNNKKEIYKKFKKDTGEDPWSSDIMAMYNSYKKELDDMYGKSETPINIARFKKTLLDNLDVFFDFHTTKESLTEDKMIDLYRFYLQQSQSNPRINGERIIEKLNYAVGGTHDPEIWRSEEEVQQLIAGQQQQAPQEQQEAEPQQEGETPTDIIQRLTQQPS